MEKFKPHPKFSHLEKDFKPIVTCITEVKSGEEGSAFPFKDIARKSSEDVENINYSASTNRLRENNILNGGYQTYVISDLNSKDKYSTGMYDCTGIVLVGEDVKTNKNISILTHEDPKQFLKPNLVDSFKEHLILSLEKILNNSKKGSIDVLIVGGHTIGYNGKNNYIESIEFIRQIIKDKLGFDPTVVTGPKGGTGPSHVYFDNDNRRLHLSMPEQGNNLTLHDFKAENVTEQLKNIEKENERRYYI